uniref:Uncharacterized protein n=1 Tax=Ciona savignyi TaxID=51511 RepID=H2YEB2_CIOSA
MRRASSSNTMHDVRKSTMRIAKQPSAIKALVEESSGSVESLSVRGVSPAKSVLSSLAETLKHSSTPHTLSRDSLTHLMSSSTPEAAMETPPPITTKLSITLPVIKSSVISQTTEEGFVPPGSDDHQLSSNSTTIYPSRTLSHGDVTKVSPSLSSHPTEEEEESKWRDILKDLRSARISKSQQKIGGPTPHQKVQLRPKLPLIQSWQDRQQDSLSVVVCRPKAHSDKPAPQRRLSNIMRGVSRAMRTSEFVVARRRSLHDLGSKYVWKTPIPPVVIRDPVR